MAAYVSWAHHTADLLHRVQVWAETAVHRENLLVDDSSNWQAVEAVSERLPELDVVSALALVVKAIDTVDRCALVVTAEDEEVLWVLDLVCEEKADSLERLLSSVNVVAKEEVVGLRWETTVLKESEEIVVLAVNITANLFKVLAKVPYNIGACLKVCADLDRSLELKEDWLGDKDLARLCAQIADLSLQKLDLLSRSASSYFQKTVNDRVKIDIALVRHCI